ncbi:D-amino acid aminotransferase [Ferrovum sp.]|uniref:D-amino acid aminotransferase n=1 Tax=Ferrovum sp. TaxID=2609467 RepID=UPI00260FDBB1|nr:D-amino acid aminotransferase [Ferrovum sp.]
MSQVYLNGVFLPLEEARIPVLDRGFLFGDGVYEVIPVYGRKPLALGAHLDRLEHSLAGIRLDNPLERTAWVSLLERLIQEATTPDQSLYLQVTRGVAPRDHGFPSGVSPTVFAMSKPLTPVPSAWVQAGVAAVTRRDDRWLHCDLKTTALLANVLLRQQALDEGAVECLLLRAGFLTEGAASNVVLVVDGVLCSPPRNSLLLAGITLDLVLHLAAQLGMAHAERPVTEEELRSAEEIWITSSTREMVPVTRLDGKFVGAGQPGPIGLRLLSAYQALKNHD